MARNSIKALQSTSVEQPSLYTGQLIGTVPWVVVLDRFTLCMLHCVCTSTQFPHNITCFKHNWQLTPLPHLQLLGTLSRIPVSDDIAFANKPVIQKKNRYKYKIPCEGDMPCIWSIVPLMATLYLLCIIIIFIIIMMQLYICICSIFYIHTYIVKIHTCIYIRSFVRYSCKILSTILTVILQIPTTTSISVQGEETTMPITSMQAWWM